MVVLRCLAVVLLASGATSSAFADDYPVIDATIPAFGAEAPAGYVDDIPIVQDLIAAPWEPVTPTLGARRGLDGLAVPDGW